MLLLAAWIGAASAQPAEEPAAEPGSLAIDDDPTFGPLVTIERIDLLGNESTSDDVIRRELPVKVGDTLRSGDPRFRASRWKLLALGHFAMVDLRLDRGGERGHVVLTVEVVERGSLVLNRIFLGSSEATPFWAGLDLGDTNFFGTGFGVGAALVWADDARIVGSRDQVGLRLRLATPRFAGGRLGLHGVFLYNRASHFERAAGPPDGDDPADFTASDYTRTGGVVGGSWDLSRLSSLLWDLRLEWIDAAADARVATVAVGYVRDTRPDPILPYRGRRLMLVAEGGKDGVIGDFDILKLRGSIESWWPIAGDRHALAVSAGAGIVLGDPPVFDRFWAGDMNPLSTPRPLELVVTTAAPLDVFGLGADERPHGSVFVSGHVEYAFRLLERAPRPLYGGQFFVQAGVLAVGDHDGDRAGMALDLTANIGLRLDTSIGVFELSLGNGLGRLPL